jgi:hypothetical protein
VKNILGYILLVVLLGAFSYGDDFEDAKVAYDTKDYKTAFQLYNSTCESGDSRGCAVVGTMFESGLGTQKNDQSALSYYVKACEMGNEIACKFSPDLQNKMPVCTQDELAFLNDKRYFRVSSSDDYPIIVADAKTIRIDKKNKTIQVWTTYVSNQKNKNSLIQGFGQNYNNFGFLRALNIINYRNMTSRIITSTDYNCDGSSIMTSGISSWQNIIPDSVMEAITDNIMKKYNLK